MRERHYSRASVALLLVSIAAVAVPFAFVLANPNESGEGVAYILALMTPVALLGLAKSALVSITAIRRGKRSRVQYATLALAALSVAVVVIGVLYLLLGL